MNALQERISGIEIFSNGKSKRIININIKAEILDKLIFPFHKFTIQALEYKPFTRFTIAKSLDELFSNKFSKLILRSKINDLSSGIFLMKREVLNDVVPVAKGHGEFMMEFLYKAEKKGNKIIEIPYIQPIDIEGHSKSFPNIAKFLYLGFFYLVRIIQSIITK